MKQKGKKKKPTLKDVVIVLNSLIQEIHAIKTDMRTISGVMNMYIEFKGDEHKFNKYVDSKIKKDTDDIQADANSSTESAWWST